MSFGKRTRERKPQNDEMNSLDGNDSGLSGSDLAIVGIIIFLGLVIGIFMPDLLDYLN